MSELTALDVKALRIAAAICWKWGSYKGDRICQDWEGDTSVLDALTAEERDDLQRVYEQYNSNGADYEPGDFPYDGMVIAYYVARHLDLLAGGE